MFKDILNGIYEQQAELKQLALTIKKQKQEFNKLLGQQQNVKTRSYGSFLY